jgi:hypothetical protein
LCEFPVEPAAYFEVAAQPRTQIRKYASRDP